MATIGWGSSQPVLAIYGACDAHQSEFAPIGTWAPRERIRNGRRHAKLSVAPPVVVEGTISVGTILQFGLSFERG